MNHVLWQKVKWSIYLEYLVCHTSVIKFILFLRENHLHKLIVCRDFNSLSVDFNTEWHVQGSSWRRNCSWWEEVRKALKQGSRNQQEINEDPFCSPYSLSRYLLEVAFISRVVSVNSIITAWINPSITCWIPAAYIQVSLL